MIGEQERDDGAGANVDATASRGPSVFERIDRLLIHEQRYAKALEEVRGAIVLMMQRELAVERERRLYEARRADMAVEQLKQAERILDAIKLGREV